MLSKMSVKDQIKVGIMTVISALLIAVSLNFFLIPANVFTSGFTGIAQILTELTSISTGILLFLLNFPLAIIGWKKVGKAFTFFSFMNVVFTVIFLETLPVYSFSQDVILNSVFGGVIGGIGVGLILKFGASSAGVDILALLFARKSDRPLGTYFFAFNAVIVLTSSAMFGLEKGMYTLLTLYITSRVIDMIHTRHVKLTAMIVTSEADKVQEALFEKITRGITRVPAIGGYTKEEKEILMVVITRYELYPLQHIISEVDPQAFTNIVQTTSVFGFFKKDD